MMRTTRVYAAILFAVTMGCSTNPPPVAGDAAASASVSKNTDIITADELADPGIASGDALAAIRRLRPRFLMSRGAVSSMNSSAGGVHVSVDGGALAGVESLARIRASQVAEIRYLSSADAAQRFGTAAGSGGVILVKSR